MAKCKDVANHASRYATHLLLNRTTAALVLVIPCSRVSVVVIDYARINAWSIYLRGYRLLRYAHCTRLLPPQRRLPVASDDMALAEITRADVGAGEQILAMMRSRGGAERVPQSLSARRIGDAHTHAANVAGLTRELKSEAVLRHGAYESKAASERQEEEGEG